MKETDRAKALLAILAEEIAGLILKEASSGGKAEDPEP